MKKKITIEAYLLCEFIQDKGKDVNLDLNFGLDRISISIWDNKTTLLFTIYSYFNIQFDEKENYVQIQNFIPTIKNYIEKELKLTA